jgi:hypothetical protein
MSWQDRLRESIVFTSPNGNVFTAAWASNTRSFEKKLGIFEHPKMLGTVVQDLNAVSTRYPLTIWFEGSDNDLEANRFYESLKEIGIWTVNHPAKGLLYLQLSTVREFIDPTENGNMTKFETEWIEPLLQSPAPTVPELAANIKSQSDELNVAAAGQLEANIAQDTASEIVAVKNSTNNILTAVSGTLANLYKGTSALNGQITGIISSIQDTIAQPVIDVVALAGQVQNLIQLPLLATTDIQTRLAAYEALIQEALGLAPDGTDPEDKNKISIQELTLTAAVGALALIASSGSLETRNQAAAASNSISDLFTDITDGLDAIQEHFIAHDIDLQYFSQSQSYSDAALIVYQSVALLSVQLFELAIEKIITVDSPTAPIIIAIEQYGGLGAGDANFDKFISINRLKGKEILILPAGKEVVVYV